MAEANLSSFIWSVADLLRGDYKQSEYGKVILPFTVLRRLDCVLEATKSAVLAEFDKRKKEGVNPEPFLLKKSGPRLRVGLPPRCGSLSSPAQPLVALRKRGSIADGLQLFQKAFHPLCRTMLIDWDEQCGQRLGGFRRRLFHSYLQSLHFIFPRQGKFGFPPEASRFSLSILCRLLNSSIKVALASAFSFRYFSRSSGPIAKSFCRSSFSSRAMA